MIPCDDEAEAEHDQAGSDPTPPAPAGSSGIVSSRIRVNSGGGVLGAITNTMESLAPETSVSVSVSVSAAPNVSETWTCQMCTFVNKASVAKCKMCL